MSQAAVSAVDVADPAPSVTCSPASGTPVTPGQVITVSCTASDASGNQSAATFTATVLTYAHVLERMAQHVESLNLNPGITVSLVYKLRGAARGTSFCAHVWALQFEIRALRGKKIPADEADRMAHELSRMFWASGCSFAPGK